MVDESNRSARKRQAIVDAATGIFLEKGYQGTSMDEIAAAAAVSKQTVYKNFADKERLFHEIILGTLDAAAEPFGTEIRSLLEATDLEPALRELARRYLTVVLQPQVIRLRRLIIGESGRLPGLARTYYERAPERTLARLAECFRELAERGLLEIEDPALAAEHFAFLILGRPLDRALFHGRERPPEPAEVTRFAEAGVRVFLAAYGRR
ncbi:TetR/AcrR family transcriptional regulator [Amycolatopsis acidicola]|uniref:TetR/AcrR family transcriptional regulator n=1 Tax=Amycolatopsis acidicola TaxID=2596893 RepID=A0A5N0V0C8_9PSEU|nr:TetR/AcrR family transcriptional regulator [Amycolatopsis acidicola]KAA9159760.1 TetR/AcrR family transcriptional regulator [Amycolatopsis acidicola]